MLLTLKLPVLNDFYSVEWKSFNSGSSRVKQDFSSSSDAPDTNAVLFAVSVAKSEYCVYGDVGMMSCCI